MSRHRSKTQCPEQWFSRVPTVASNSGVLIVLHPHGLLTERSLVNRSQAAQLGYAGYGYGWWWLGTGYWVLGYWVLGTGYWVLDHPPPRYPTGFHEGPLLYLIGPISGPCFGPVWPCFSPVWPWFWSRFGPIIGPIIDHFSDPILTIFLVPTGFIEFTEKFDFVVLRVFMVFGGLAVIRHGQSWSPRLEGPAGVYK